MFEGDPKETAREPPICNKAKNCVNNTKNTASGFIHCDDKFVHSPISLLQIYKYNYQYIYEKSGFIAIRYLA
jgi:hypothetical protein